MSKFKVGDKISICPLKESSSAHLSWRGIVAEVIEITEEDYCLRSLYNEHKYNGSYFSIEFIEDNFLLYNKAFKALYEV